ncbi:hypothetical protein HFO06_34480 [Rhizobium leguminosarum]|uniref:hypothetical protein n=1 Tax=Rhizobium leguminosarum TaxID=384 RepID=UPI001C9758E1|nr:hypothetical protein [Rhizobium leguminosarum]MBY5768122.1 hypothetical protein [Rhizobium leguminosarum]
MTRFSKINTIDLTVRRRLALTQISFPKFSDIISRAVRNLLDRVGTNPLVAHESANTAKSPAAGNPLQKNADERLAPSKRSLVQAVEAMRRRAVCRLRSFESALSKSHGGGPL